MSSLSLLRYASQTILPEMGEEGQRRLFNTSVLCVGAGGLGSAVLPYLVGAGIGKIGIADADCVSLANLHRQILYTEKEIGGLKVEVAAKRLQALNKEVEIVQHPVRITAQNAQEIFSAYEIILDGSDNFETQFLLNDVCVILKKPLVHAAILGFSAQISVFWAPFGPCYRCLYRSFPQKGVPACSEGGVLGPLCAMAGGVVALETLKIALGLSWCAEHGLEPLLGRVLVLNGKTLAPQIFSLPKDPECLVCTSHAKRPLSFFCELSAQESHEKLGRALFLDVREPHEWHAFGMIPGALGMPLGGLQVDEKALFDLDKNQEIIVYCQHGVRSKVAAQLLVERGFKNISHLKGGFVAWNLLTQGENSRI